MRRGFQATAAAEGRRPSRRRRAAVGRSSAEIAESTRPTYSSGSPKGSAVVGESRPTRSSAPPRRARHPVVGCPRPDLWGDGRQGLRAAMCMPAPTTPWAWVARTGASRDDRAVSTSERANADVAPAPAAPATVSEPVAPALSAARILALQRTAGNTAVARLLQRDTAALNPLMPEYEQARKDRDAIVAAGKNGPQTYNPSTRNPENYYGGFDV